MGLTRRDTVDRPLEVPVQRYGRCTILPLFSLPSLPLPRPRPGSSPSRLDQKHGEVPEGSVYVGVRYDRSERGCESLPPAQEVRRLRVKLPRS